MSSGREIVGYLRLNGKNYPLFQGLNIIGRNKLATVIMRNPTISHYHSILTVLEGGKFFLSDLNSANGTFVNEEKLKPMQLKEISSPCKIRFSSIPAVFVESATQSNPPSPTKSNLHSQNTQNLETFFIAATQKLDVIEEVSIHDLPTQVEDFPSKHKQDESLKNNLESTELKDLPNIHDLPTQVLCADVAVEISIGNSNSDLSDIDCSTKNHLNSSHDNQQNSVINEVVEDTVLAGNSFQVISQTNKTTNYLIENLETSSNFPSENDKLINSPKLLDSNRQSPCNLDLETVNESKIKQSPSRKSPEMVKLKENDIIQSPNASQKSFSDAGSQCDLQVNQLKRKTRRRIASGSETPSSLDSETPSPSPIRQVKMKNRCRLSSDDSGDYCDSKLDENKTKNRTIPRRNSSSKLYAKKIINRKSDNSSSDTDVEHIQMKFEIKSIPTFEKIGSNSETDIDGDHNVIDHHCKESKTYSHKTGTSDDETEKIRSEIIKDDIMCSQFTQGSFKLALTNTMDTMNTDSESDFVFKDISQNLEEPQAKILKQLKTSSITEDKILKENTSNMKKGNSLKMDSIEVEEMNGESDNDELFIHPTQELPVKQKISSQKENNKDSQVKSKSTTLSSDNEEKDKDSGQTTSDTLKDDSKEKSVARQEYDIRKDVELLKEIDSVYIESIKNNMNISDDEIKNQSQQFINTTQSEHDESHSQKDVDSIFLEPTQKFTIPTTTDEEDEDVFLTPTQKISDSTNTQNYKGDNSKLDSQNEDEIYLEPTQKFIVPEDPKTKKSVEKRYSQNEDDEDIFLQPTQKFAINDNKIKSGAEKLAKSNNSNDNNDNNDNNDDNDDVYLQATQEFVIPSSSTTKSTNNKIIERKKETLEPIPSVESQLEVMFCSQTNISFLEDSNRPGNPLVSVLNEEESQQIESSNHEVETGKAKQEMEKSTATEENEKQSELNMHTIVLADISPEKISKRRASSSSSDGFISGSSLKRHDRKRGPSCVEVSLENQRAVPICHSVTLSTGSTNIRRSRQKTHDKGDTKCNIEGSSSRRSTRRTISGPTVASTKKSSSLKRSNDAVPTGRSTLTSIVLTTETSDIDPTNDVFKSKKFRRKGRSESAVSKRSSEMSSPPATPQKRKKIAANSSSNESAISSPVQSRGLSPEKRTGKIKVVFTMLDNPQLSLIVRQCGGMVVDTVEAATVLVTESVKRTRKLLTAVGLGKPICSVKWLEDSKKAKQFLDPWNYILIDKEAEMKWNFSLIESLKRSKEKSILEGYTFQLCVNNATDVLKAAIESCGGKCVTRAPIKSNKTFIVIASPENKSKCKKYLQKIPPVTVIVPEAIFHGVLIQRFEVDHYLLS